MKNTIMVGDQELELVFTSLAVEKIEDEFDTTLDELFESNPKLKAKMVNFILWAISNTEMSLTEFKKILAQKYTYNECINKLTEAFGGDPNAVIPIENATEVK